MSLKRQALSGFKWSFIDSFSRYFLTFFIGIVLARLLTPEDYGLIGMTGIFLALSRVFIDGGFSDALIRKIEPTKEDYSSVFIFNLSLAMLFFILLFSLSPLIANFFDEPRLILIIRVVGVTLIIGATSTVQVIILKKRLDFKMQAVIGFISTLISGIVSVSLAIADYGVWSLVLGGLVSGLSTGLLLWQFNNWRPKFFFSVKIIKEHFNFGSKIMLGSFVNTIYDNMYYVLIGKLFNPTQLGFYTRADGFQKLPASTIDVIVRQVTYPLFSNIQNEPDRLKETYRTLIQTTSFLVFILLLGLAAVAKPFIVILIGEKWLQSVPYLQLLCFVGVFYPLISINLNILNVKGRSDLSLFIQVLKVIFSIPALLLGYYYGITPMIFGMIGASLTLFLFVIFLTNRMIEYSPKEQLTDIGKSFLFGIAVVFPVFVLSITLHFKPPVLLFILLLTSLFAFILTGELSKNKVYNMIKAEFISKLNIRK
jgi:O-antigen/teichoic acid export membrane protein